MMGRILITAALTGGFCSVFAVCIDFVTDMLDQTTVAGGSFVSGFMGSIFAQTVLGGMRNGR